MDPHPHSPWSRPETVASFTQSAPNEILLRFAERERRQARTAHALDLGCGAGRNALPLARSGWRVVAVDLSWPMLTATASRARAEDLGERLGVIRATMEELPVRARSIDLVIAHGIWNLAGSAAEFRRAVHEAARVARPGAGLFVFTFSRNTLPPDAEPVPGEPFVFTQFSGQPQCFLTAAQLVSELAAAGFAIDPSVPLTEYNRPRAGAPPTGTVPVIYEATFRLSGVRATSRDTGAFRGTLRTPPGAERRAMPESPEILRDRGRALEDEFFHREDQRLIKRLTELKAAEASREALTKASGITAPAVLDQLLQLGIRAETLAALSVVPLVEVAWADGDLDAEERRTIVERAGIAHDSTARALLEAWLDRRPDTKLFTAWAQTVQAMRSQLAPDAAARLKASLLEQARAVAAASGGLFGIGSKVSRAEAEMLTKLEAAFG